MGAPMARHLLKAGHDVALWSNTASKAKELAKEGAGKWPACATPEAEVAKAADVIFYCVGDTAMAREITRWVPKDSSKACERGASSPIAAAFLQR